MNFLFVLSLFFALVVSVSGSYTPSDIPNPHYSPQRCGRSVDSAVCDPSLIISSQKKDEIEGYINTIKVVEIGVLIIPKMADMGYGPSNNALSKAEIFATTVHNKWGVGNYISQNGVLIFVSTDDRVTYISKGAGVKMTEFDVNRVTGAMKEILRESRFGDAISKAIIMIDQLHGDEINHKLGGAGYGSSGYSGYGYSGARAIRDRRVGSNVYISDNNSDWLVTFIFIIFGILFIAVCASQLTHERRPRTVYVDGTTHYVHTSRPFYGSSYYTTHSTTVPPQTTTASDRASKIHENTAHKAQNLGARGSTKASFGGGSASSSGGGATW